MTMLLPSINKPLNGVIWRMEIDSLSDTIYLETRTPEKQVSFTSIDLATGKTNFENYTTPERWLTGIEAAYDGVLLLHGYQSENSPVHKGLTAIDKNAQTVWSNYAYAFDHLTVNGAVVFNTQFQPKKLFLIDIKTGATLRPYNPCIDLEVNTSIQFPTAALPSDLDFEVHGNIVQSLYYNKLRIVSLHTLSKGQLEQRLLITDAAALVFEDLLNTDIQKMQPESFILYKSLVIYIKDKAILKVIPLINY
ncbi:DUF4905 domain-containing protein [Mucilaginibacter ximonensis]|uniref:DUF4905 domain-containing protein n=1 Tax=Mucilaginibacter ximonensis TaxID=538021 RepID=A0ABW5YA42_9SPHI